MLSHELKNDVCKITSVIKLITARKVIFSEACVKNSVHRGEGAVEAGRGACVAGGHAWPGVLGCAFQGVCMAGGHVWLGGMHAGGHAHAMHAPQPDIMRYGRSMSGWYASYWNAFLFIVKLPERFPKSSGTPHFTLNCIKIF